MNYLSSLDNFDLQRYKEKIKICGSDPYDIREDECSTDFNLFPKITEVDRLDYFIYNTNFVDKEAMKCLKSLEAHNFFTSGHVFPLYIKKMSSDSVLILTKMGWMGEENKQHAILRLDNMSLYEEPYHINETAIDHSQEFFKVVQGDPVQTILNVRKRVIERDYSRLSKTFNNDKRWLSKVENDLLFPRYLDDQNQLYLPTKFLQKVLFNPKRENHINCAVLGSMIAREIAHAFFPKGINGLPEWIVDINEVKYSPIELCFRNQYKASSKREPLANVITGIIAEHMGFRTAYMVNAKSESQTTHKSFWYHAAFSLCSEYTNEAMNHLGQRALNIPPQLRVNNFFNLKEFQDDLQCPLNSKMRPNTTCNIV